MYKMDASQLEILRKIEENLELGTFAVLVYDMWIKGQIESIDFSKKVIRMDTSDSSYESFTIIDIDAITAIKMFGFDLINNMRD